MGLLDNAIPPGSVNYWMFNNRRIGHDKKRSWLPRRCYISNRQLWFKKCDVIHCMVTGPGEPVFETYWCDSKEFIFYELRKSHG